MAAVLNSAASASRRAAQPLPLAFGSPTSSSNPLGRSRGREFLRAGRLEYRRNFHPSWTTAVIPRPFGKWLPSVFLEHFANRRRSRVSFALTARVRPLRFRILQQRVRSRPCTPPAASPRQPREEGAPGPGRLGVCLQTLPGGTVPAGIWITATVLACVRGDLHPQARARPSRTLSGGVDHPCFLQLPVPSRRRQHRPPSSTVRHAFVHLPDPVPRTRSPLPPAPSPTFLAALAATTLPFRGLPPFERVLQIVRLARA